MFSVDLFAAASPTLQAVAVTNVCLVTMDTHVACSVHVKSVVPLKTFVIRTQQNVSARWVHNFKCIL